jgi:hypothetical protein
MCNETTFFRELGLKANPFQYTNADEEDNLKDYFVPPPYFQSVWGDTQKPTSCLIFAPRGGGKSAQRKMIEERSIESNILALQYSRFEFEKGQNISGVDLEYHLRNIIRICLIGLLMQIFEKGLKYNYFSNTERENINNLCGFYLGDMNQDQVINAIKAITSPFGKAKKFFESKLWIINNILGILFAQAGLLYTPYDQIAQGARIARPSKNHLETILTIITKLGFDSIYILIDKVDETQLTGNDAEASYGLIDPILRDLDLLQMRNVAFKLFLWNEIFPFYKQWARPDRISQFDLKWSKEELKKILRLRLQAFSSNGAPSFYDLFDDSMNGDVKKAIEDLLITFSHGSPRDMIRICSQMVAEQLRTNPYSKRVGFSAVTQGFNIFCEERAKEVISEKILRELQKTHKLDFGDYKTFGTKTGILYHVLNEITRTVPSN